MPIYEFQCNTCNMVFDCVVLKADEMFEPECSKCGSVDVKKLVSRVSCLAGPKKDTLASNVENKMLKSLGGNVSDKTRQELKELSKKAADRGKRRFDSMMDTGKSDSVDY